VAGSSYDELLQATGDTGSYTWEVVSGTLPSGLNLLSDGLLSGTIAASADAYHSSFTVRVTGSGGQTATAAVQLAVMISVTATCMSSWDVLTSMTVSIQSAWTVGNPTQPNMRQMASVSWISMLPS
jgi:hypothetical protein